MESKTKNRKTREQIAAMVDRSFPGTCLAAGEDAVREFKEGWFNAAYSVRLIDGWEVILKIAPHNGTEIMAYEKNIMETEAAVMQLVSQNPAIPVPEIYVYDGTHELCDSDYFFMEKVPGDNLGQVSETLPPAIRSKIDYRTGAIVKEINGFTGAYFGYDGNSVLRADTWKAAFNAIIQSLLDDGDKKCAEYGFSPGEIWDTLQKHNFALDEVTTPCLVHWDAWDLNFFIKDNRITGIIDFERALWGDPLMEAPFQLLAWGGNNDRLRGYGKTTFTHEEDVRCHLYHLHLALVMKTECYYRNYDTDEVSTGAKVLLAKTMKWLQEN
jgi:aminoglycoside phosphotransferase (APT) family kinase protein